jgi:predicted enzyme related to lactoylglutathione lyase
MVYMLSVATMTPSQDRPVRPAPIVFFDLAGPKIDELKAFYADVFGWKSDAGTFTIPVTSPLPSSFRQDPTDKRIYIGVDNITKALDEIKRRGGSIDTPRFEVKGVAILGLFRDPAGNSMGLVEMQDGKPKVP